MRKAALVISGGGSKGAFAVGAVKFLAEHHPDINFEVLVGTSTGSLIVPMAALGEISLLEQLYTTVKTEDIILGGNIGARFIDAISIFDAKPLSHLIEKFYNDETSQKIFTLNKQVFIITTCLQTSRSVIFSTQDPPIITDYEIMKVKNGNEFRRSILASACQPVFMQPIEVHQGSLPVRQYVDGGVLEYIGIQLAIDAGAEEVFAIALSPEKSQPEEKKFTRSLEILFKTIDIFTADVGANDIRIPRIYNRALQYIAAVKDKMRTAGLEEEAINEFFDIPFNNQFSGKKPIILHSIHPDKVLEGGPGGLEFNPAKMKEMVRLGEQKMQEYMTNPTDRIV